MKWSLIDYAALFLFTFVTTVTIMTFIYSPAYRIDFSIYLIVTRLITQHQAIYPLFVGGVLFPYTHPPSLMPFFLPFLFFPQDVGASIWNVFSLLSVVCAVLIMIKASQVKLRFSHILLILSVVLLLEPVRDTFLFGNNNTTVLPFLGLSFLFSQKYQIKFKVLSGICLGIAVALKLFPLFIIFYFVVKKQWISSIATVVTFLIFLVGGALGHISYILQYIQYTKVAMTSLRPIPGDQSLSAFILSFYPLLQHWKSAITSFVYLLFLIAVVILWKMRNISRLSDFLLFAHITACTILLITPLAWESHTVFLIPLTLALLLKSLQTKSKIAAALFVGVFSLTYMNGEDTVLLMEKTIGGYFPLFYFHALAGLFLAVCGAVIFSLKPSSKKA